jgi:translocation and assembly module TamB
VSDRPVDLQIQTEAFPVDWIDPFVDPALVTGIAGSLSADVQVGGTLGTPDVRGTTRLTGGTARLTDLGVEYRRARSTLTFDGGQVRMSDTEVFDDDGGRLSGTGTIELAALTLGRFDLDLNADDFVAIDTRAYRSVRVDGGLQVSGTTRQPVVGGDLTVLQGDIYAAETAAESGSELANVPLTDEDQLLLEQRFNVRISEADTTTFDAYQALALDVEVEIRRDTWLRQRANPEMNVQFTGSLNVEKASGSDAQVFGTIDVVTERSTIRQFGQQFRIEEGTLTFNGDPTEPYLRLTAVYEKQSRLTSDTEVRITLSAQGRPDDLDLQLSSQPQMDTRNILSYLATGQPASQLLGGGSGGGTSGSTGDLAENLAIGQLTSLAENFAASNVGLDVVRIQYQPDGGSYFVLGRYLTPRFYVAIEQPVSVNDRTQGTTSSLAPDLTFEYELTDTLLMRLQSRQQSLRFNLLFEYAY